MTAGNLPGDDHLVEVRAAYQAWLGAAAGACGSPAALGRAVSGQIRKDWKVAWAAAQARADIATARELEQRLMEPTDPLPEGTVRGWIKRASLSKDNDVRAALVVVIERLLGDPPEEAGAWRSFRAVVDRLGALNSAQEASGSRRGTARIRTAAESRQDAELSRWLVGPPVARPAELDHRLLRLGSWLVDGAIPPYAPRTVDATLDEHLGTVQRRLIVVAGPPKSGKTRTLVEALGRARPDSPVLWALPDAGAVQAITAAAAKDPDRDRLVVVLDDLQLHALGRPDGLTGAQVARLLATGVTVAATIHRQALSELERRSRDHRASATLAAEDPIGADPVLADQLSANTIILKTELTEPELRALPADIVSAAARYKVGRTRLARLAETLAAVDQLLTACNAAHDDPSQLDRWALISAAIDAAYLTPGGISAERLALFTRWAWQRLAPTRPWAAFLFENALAWATMPIGGHGSPHAVLTFRSVNTEGPFQTDLAASFARYLRDRDPQIGWYRLLDVLPDRLQPIWSPTHLAPHMQELSAAERFNAGAAAAALGEREEARTWFASAASDGNNSAMQAMSAIASAADDPAATYEWALRARRASVTRRISAELRAYSRGLRSDQELEKGIIESVFDVILRQSHQLRTLGSEAPLLWRESWDAALNIVRQCKDVETALQQNLVARIASEMKAGFPKAGQTE